MPIQRQLVKIRLFRQLNATAIDSLASLRDLAGGAGKGTYCESRRRSNSASASTNCSRILRTYSVPSSSGRMRESTRLKPSILPRSRLSRNPMPAILSGRSAGRKGKPSPVANTGFHPTECDPPSDKSSHLDKIPIRGSYPASMSFCGPRRRYRDCKLLILSSSRRMLIVHENPKNLVPRRSAHRCD
jgi:hypothetical protein